MLFKGESNIPNREHIVNFLPAKCLFIERFGEIHAPAMRNLPPIRPVSSSLTPDRDRRIQNLPPAPDDRAQIRRKFFPPATGQDPDPVMPPPPRIIEILTPFRYILPSCESMASPSSGHFFLHTTIRWRHIKPRNGSQSLSRFRSY